MYEYHILPLNEVVEEEGIPLSDFSQIVHDGGEREHYELSIPWYLDGCLMSK
ncbi:4004_t:CDS:2, partial [Diversispora eburnea]